LTILFSGLDTHFSLHKEFFIDAIWIVGLSPSKTGLPVLCQPAGRPFAETKGHKKHSFRDEVVALFTHPVKPQDCFALKRSAAHSFSALANPWH
jgi:hypothetical protein